MGRKPIGRTAIKGYLNLRIGKRMKAEFEKAAAEQDKSASALGRELIGNYLKERKNPAPK